MKNKNSKNLVCLLLILLAPAAALAEQADRDKPINLEADTVTVDDATKTSTYQGNVQLTQGTLLIRADKLVVKEDATGLQHGTAHGNPASFRQKREGLDEYVEGYGQRIEYDGKNDKVELFTQARMKRNQDEVRGNYISYDAKTEFFQVLGGGKEAAAPGKEKGRVRAVILPKAKPGQGAATPAPVPLQGAESIAQPRAE
jgi:lipopolysaccharide export system protein LptA